MKESNKIVITALTGVFTLATFSATIPTTYAATEPQMEKCYGIAKSGMNDCKTSTSSCASSAIKDKQADAFLFVPQGLCTKIVDGSLTAKTDK